MKTPQYAANTILHVKERDAGITKSIGRVNHRRIDPKGTDPERFQRRHSMTVVNVDNELKVLVFAMGAPEVPLDGIAVDYDARVGLGVKFQTTECDLIVRPARYREIISHYLSHADMGRKLSMQLGLLGAALGALSFLHTLLTLVTRL